MKAFHCDGCGSLVFFDNVKCVACGHALGFLPEAGELSALEPVENGVWRVLTEDRGEERYRLCKNGQDHGVCNWMVRVNDPNPFCISCQLNDLIPNLSVPGNLERWHKIEMAKRRIVYSLMHMGLPLESASEEGCPALRFKFIGEIAGGPAPVTGHLNGTVTINIAEADDVERERRRINLHEPYRTLLGHLRHEVAHYYWDRLIANGKWLARFRQLFGDETADYANALSQYYQRGAPPDWQERFVSAYASAHPWEDWAETCAHYFHIIDMVETAGSFGMVLKPKHPAAKSMTTDLQNACELNLNFDSILKNWFPLTHALNALNRGMGLPDAYPFVLSSPAIEKLRFIHEVVQSARINKQIAPAAREFSNHALKPGLESEANHSRREAVEGRCA